MLDLVYTEYRLSGPRLTGSQLSGPQLSGLYKTKIADYMNLLQNTVNN